MNKRRSEIREVAAIIAEVQNQFPGTRIGVHCHNDCGLGVALSLEGVAAGAEMVQGTINGYGERVGNANLTSIIPNLSIKLKYKLSCNDHMTELKSLSNLIDDMAHRIPSRRSPFVGKSAFAHKGGVHANAAKKVAHSYEHMKPQLVGNEQRILLSDMSGGTSIEMKAAKMGISIDRKSPLMKSFVSKLKQLENEGHEFENADASFFVLLHEHFFDHKNIFDLVSYRVISEVIRDSGKNVSEAVVKLKLKEFDEVKIAVAESTGPVGALDHAARIAFGAHFPFLNEVKLEDYKVRILQTGQGTDSITQVLMKSTDGHETWWTCGADPNIIEASWEALRDSFRYKMIRSNESIVLNGNVNADA